MGDNNCARVLRWIGRKLVDVVSGWIGLYWSWFVGGHNIVGVGVSMDKIFVRNMCTVGVVLWVIGALAE